MKGSPSTWNYTEQGRKNHEMIFDRPCSRCEYFNNGCSLGLSREQCDDKWKQKQTEVSDEKTQ